MDKECKTKSLFTANLIRLRKEAGLSQKRLAESSGLTHNFVNDMEKMKKSASLGTIDQLSKALGIEPIQFFIDPGHWDNNEDEHFWATLDCLNENINRVFDNYRKDKGRARLLGAQDAEAQKTAPVVGGGVAPVRGANDLR
jgi:transcriptional regulator with XRE-family HTH domain